jgi:hypothetical protein
METQEVLTFRLEIQKTLSKRSAKEFAYSICLSRA